MKKIKNFKITLKPRELVRLYKNTQKTAPALAGIEEQAESLAAQWSKAFHPATVYETFWKENVPQALSGLFQGPLDGAAAASFVLVSCPLPAGFSAPEPWPSILMENALDEAITFVGRLAAEEAKGEHCELGPLWKIQDANVIQTLFHLLDGSKIRALTASLDVPCRAAGYGWIARARAAKRS